jgi:CRP-like cAMP-binding protein
MQDGIECADLFAAQLNSANPEREAEAGAAMMRAGRASQWRRNQPCDGVIARGAVACILRGVVRKFALRFDGHRQIIDLVVAGDYVGFAPVDPAFFLEAVSNDTRIVSFTRDQIVDLTVRFPAIAALMQRCASDALSRLEHHLLVQGRMTAREKVVAYLAEMARRMEPSGPNAIVLPITRYDIADHLGIAVETVSRTMTVLRRHGSIALKTPRDVEICDLSILSGVEH